MTVCEQIVFVSEMRNPKTSGSSTQIMTRNLLYGFSKICDRLLFVAVVEKQDDTDDIRTYYSSITPNIYFVIENSKNKTDVLKRQFVWLADTYRSHADRVPSELERFLDTDTILVSQSPGLDAALICKEMKLRYPTIFYVQYWGDPLALSLITPQQYTPKRYILKLIEKRLHKFADKIVFGTESLCSAQLQQFPEIKGKTMACDVSFMPEAIDDRTKIIKHTFGYFGNYYTSIRNILPLYEAFKQVENGHLVICGSSDIKLEPTEQVEVLDRIPQDQVENEESKIDVEVCILNSVGIQIPGKVFYHTNTAKHILVLSDGPVADSIEIELGKSSRFIICKNEQKAIEKTVRAIIAGKFDTNKYDKTYYSPERVCRQIVNKL